MGPDIKDYKQLIRHFESNQYDINIMRFCGRAPWHKKLLEAERVYSDAHFKAKVPHGREVQMERARNSWFYHTSNRKEETYKSMLLFSCLSLPTLARERRHPQWAGCSPSPLSTNTTKIIPHSPRSSATKLPVNIGVCKCVYTKTNTHRVDMWGKTIALHCHISWSSLSPYSSKMYKNVTGEITNMRVWFQISKKKKNGEYRIGCGLLRFF